MNSLNDNILSNTEKTLQPKVIGTLVTKQIRHSEKIETTSNPHHNRPSRWPGMSIEFQVKTLLMIKFMRPLRDFMEQFHAVNPKKILRENIRNGFRNDHHKFRIDCTKIIFSKGNLPLAPGLSVSSPKSGKLVFTWTDNSGIGKCLASDKVFVAVFNRELKRWIFKSRAADRSTGHCSIGARPFSSKRVQTFIGFVSADGVRVSDSLFMGEVRVLKM
jgi:hypothetical protein